MEKAIDSIFRSESIRPKRYYKNTLTGEGCEHLQKKGNLLGERIKVVMKNGHLRRSYLIDHIDDRIDSFMNFWMENVDLLNKICKIICRKEDSSPEEMNYLQQTIDLFGVKWREFNQYNHITPTFHILESHSVDQLRRHKSLGKHSAEYIERYHHVFNEEEKNYLHINDVGKREQAIQQNLRLSSAPEFQRPIEEMKRGIKRKRQDISEESDHMNVDM
jgi:hypothetical protein